MTRISVQHVDVSVCTIVDCPHIALDTDNFEQTAALYFPAPAGHLIGFRRRPLEVGLANRLVAFLDLRKEGIEPSWTRVTGTVQDCEYAGRLENARSLFVAHI